MAQSIREKVMIIIMEGVGNVRDIRILFLLLYSASLISSMCGKEISLKAYLTFLFVTRIDVKLVM